MSRLSFRPRPLDIHKKLPIVRSIKEFEDDDVPTATATRNSQLQRIAAEVEIEVHQSTVKRIAQEIPIPQFVGVESYESDYSRTFNQPTSYLRGRGARSELGEFVEYDLDSEDEDWIGEFNNERKIISPEKFEILLFKLEVLDHKARERAGVIAATYSGPVPVLLHLDSAFEALQSLSLRYAVFQSVYSYWRKKRGRWQKPILRRLQPPPPVNDTNPYNVFRPREKAHRLHTRRMQRRENNVQSFEKLRQVRRNLEQAKTVLGALIKREEKKREVMESEVKLQQFQMKHKHEAQFVEDGLALPGLSAISWKFGSSEDDPMDSDDGTVLRPRSRGRPSAARNPSFTESRHVIPTGRMKRPLKREPPTTGWVHTKAPEPVGPIMFFTRPLDPDKLAAAGIVPPPDPPVENGSTTPPYRFHGRIGRGGRIIFDRWNPFLQAPLGYDISPYKAANPRL